MTLQGSRLYSTDDRVINDHGPGGIEKEMVGKTRELREKMP
jgi:hypothetical protein